MEEKIYLAWCLQVRKNIAEKEKEATMLSGLNFNGYSIIDTTKSTKFTIKEEEFRLNMKKYT